MSSLSCSPAKEEEVFWTEKEALLKEEEDEKDVTIQKQVEGEAVPVKEEEKDVSVEEKEETGYLGPVSPTHLNASYGSDGELGHKMVLRNRAVINTSKYCLKNRGTNSAVVELMCGVKGEICNCYIYIIYSPCFMSIK
jgi:hypothetical protein